MAVDGDDVRPELGVACPDEWAEAFELLFSYCPADERPGRVAHAFDLLARRALAPEGVFVLRENGVSGVVVWEIVPGSTGLVWPPRARSGPTRSGNEDRLASAVLALLQQRGARLGQCLLSPEEADLAAPLLRNGFRHVTALWYLRHERVISPTHLGGPERLTFQSYVEADRDRFHETLLRSYEETLDCPEVAGVRTLDEVLTGHKAQGIFDPSLWWLALEKSRPVGVLLVTQVREPPGWEIAYVGIVPEQRRRGFGRELMLKALLEACIAEVPEVTLSVDARNHPAWALYRSLGFVPFDRREVFLALWNKDDRTW